jgi:hypothetical protein
MSPAQATTPDSSWRGVDRLHILAQLTGPLDSTIDAAGFCERVRRIAADGSPMPVQCVSIGEAMAADAAGKALVVVQAAIQPTGDGRVLVGSARRTASAGLEPAPNLLGATPRAARLSDAAPDAAADQALREALTEILPWLSRP